MKTMKELQKTLKENKLVACAVKITDEGCRHDLILRKFVAKIPDDDLAVIVEGDKDINVKYKYYIIDTVTGLSISNARSIAQAKALMNGTDFAKQVKNLRIDNAKNEWYQRRKYEFNSLLEENLETLLDKYLEEKGGEEC